MIRTRRIHMDTLDRKLRGASTSVDKRTAGTSEAGTASTARAEQRVRVTVLGRVSRQSVLATSLADDAAILRRRGMTLEDIAQALGVNERTVRRWLA